MAFSTPSGGLEAGCGGGTAEAGNAACCSGSGGPVSRGSAPRSPVPAGLCRGCAARLLLTRHGWSFSLDSHGEGTEQLQTHKQILLQQAVGRELFSACQAACVTACRQVAAEGDWLPPSESILQRCSRVMECAVEEQPAGLLFCLLEEALLNLAALPNSACRELLGRGEGEKCHSCAPPLALPLVFCRQLHCQCVSPFPGTPRVMRAPL